MAKPNAQSDAMMTNESPLARAEASRYVDQQKSADFNRNVSQYMFWGATTVMGGVVAATLGIAGASLTFPLLLAGVGASALTFVGSVFFSRKATEIGEQSNVLYSDVDSQNQARRMVQAFARAQAPDAGKSSTDTPMTAAAVTPTADTARGSWADRVGAGTSASRSESWQNRVIEQADREDAQALQNLR